MKKYLTNTPLEKAKQDYAAFLSHKEGQPDGENSINERKFEILPSAQAIGRITANAVYAEYSSPDCNRSAMDGIAIKACKTFGASETNPVKLDAHEYTRIDTGDPLPSEYDAVVMIEEVITAQDGFFVREAAVPWQHVRQIGEDMSAGDMLLKSFEKITPYAAGALLAAGVLSVRVIKRPIVTIIPTGDELVPPEFKPEKGQIAEFNSAVFAGMLAEWGCLVRVAPIVKDCPEDMCAALSCAAAQSDLVLINAGSSAGRDDYTVSVLEKLGHVCLHGVAIKPGKPVILGAILQKSRMIPVVGVPGYTVSGVIVLEQFVKPLAETFLRVKQPERVRAQVRLARTLNSSLKYEEFIRAKVFDVNGTLLAIPIVGGAGVITSLVQADALLRIPQNSEFIEAGTEISAELLKSLAEIQNTVAVTGSHDPLIDEIADLLRIEDAGVLVSSSHTGSMGAITAVKRGEAHLGGIHLMDETGDTYNESWVRRFFADTQTNTSAHGGILLIEGVKRVQGFMTAQGNPHGIRGFADIESKKLSYVNRQKGSGTRLLCDYLLKIAKLTSGTIYGYEREEYTHSAVAAIVASGSADVGLGIYAAAKHYKLDFIPVRDEEYDFLIASDAFKLPRVQRFLAVLQSEVFKSRLEALGGYKIEQPGRVKLELTHG